MKTNRVILILSAGCAAWLFAQEPMGMPQADRSAESDSQQAAALVAEDVPVVAGDVQPAENEAPEATAQMPAAAEEGMVSEVESAVGEVAPANEEQADEENPVEVDQIGMIDELAAQGTLSDELVSLSLKDVELQDVVRMFSRLSGVNIIVPDLSQGQGEGQQASKRIDVNLENVEWKPALQAILDTQDLELFEKIPGSEVYSIRKKLPPAEAPRTTRTFVLNYADINNVATMVKGIVGGQGEVFPYMQGNSIVVKTTQDVMNDVAQVVENVDKPRQQVLIESRIMELSDENRNARGVNYSWGNILEGVPNTPAATRWKVICFLTRPRR
ncbi:MAG TPA: secretin N-terminal domain-containing protein [Tichowtungia sp.]|nr:secretin N-terminal domain-containing protein [Tichowtungia sp.]